MSHRQPNFHDSSSANSSPRPRDDDRSRDFDLPLVHSVQGGGSIGSSMTLDLPPSLTGTKQRSPTSHERNASLAHDTTTGTAIKKTRSNIVTTPNNGGLAPISGATSGSSHQRELSRSPSDLSQLAQSSNGSTSERDRSRTPVNSKNSSSIRSLSPLRARPSMAVGAPSNTKPPTSSASSASSRDPASPAGALPRATYAHLSIHTSTNLNNLTPSNAPTPITALPHATGIVMALHVGNQCFLTTPETLLRVTQLEGKATSTNGDISLLQWMGEDALLKHRECLNENSRASGGGGVSPSLANNMTRLRLSSSDASESSPRNLPSLSSPSSMNPLHAPNLSSPTLTSTSTSTIHNEAPIPYHVPTYSYFLDRNPISYDLILDYLRDGAGVTKDRLKNVTDLATLHALAIESDHFNLGVLNALVQAELLKRSNQRFLSDDDLFWSDCVERIDALFPNDSLPGLPPFGAASPRSTNGGASSPRTSAGMSNGSMTTRGNLQKNIGNMLRRLAFQRDQMLRVVHATYRHTDDYEDRLLEILHTSCTICQRKIFFRPIGLREGRESGCPVHPPSGQWDRKARQWSCCGNPEFQSGCQFTGVHYTLWTFLNSD